MTKISGAAYEPEIDEDRLRTQMGWVLSTLQDTSTYDRGAWWTVDEIRAIIQMSKNRHVPEASISAQIRNLRKQANGGYRITGRYRKGLRIYEYRLEGQREGPEQGEMF